MIAAFLAFVAGVLVGLFIMAQMLLPLIYGLPAALVGVAKRRLRLAAIPYQLAAPVFWIVLLVGLGYVLQLVAPTFLAALLGNRPFNAGQLVGTGMLLLNFLSPKGRADMARDFQTSTAARFGRHSPEAESELNPGTQSPRFAELYWAYSVKAVTNWLDRGFPIVRDAFAQAGTVVDRDTVAEEALPAAFSAGMFALDGLSARDEAAYLRDAARGFGFSKSLSEPLTDLYEQSIAEGADDRVRAEILGYVLLRRLGLGETDSWPASLANTVGMSLWAEAILTWRRVQEHGETAT